MSEQQILHGVILPYDFIDQKPLDASLAHVSKYVRKLKNTSDAVFLVDNGDNIQGQPSVYYYNYIDTVSPHFMAEVFNWMGYDASTAGNHDIEAGHSVYDRLVENIIFLYLRQMQLIKGQENLISNLILLLKKAELK